MKIDQQSYPFPLSASFVTILETEITKADLPSGSGVIFNFRDPDYSAEKGGFHPVEILVSSRRRIQYITDFAYVGRGPFAELSKEIDFDISLGIFQHFGREFPLSAGQELFNIWMGNFVSYYGMGVFQVTVTEA